MSRQTEALRIMHAGYRQSDAGAAALQQALHAFKENRDKQFHFTTQLQSEALSVITSVIEDGDPGIVLVTGEPGCGKTLWRTVLSQQLAEHGSVSVSVESALLGFDDLLLEIFSQLRRLRLWPRDYPDRYSRLAAYKEALMAEVIQKGGHLVLLMDEAQQMDADTLEGVRSLCNIGAERQNYMTPILFGQTRLRDLIQPRPELAARIAAVIHLEPLTLEEMHFYLRHRLDAAGFPGPMPFSDEALTALYECTRGVPRSLNRLCKLTIRQAMIRNKRIADARCVHEAADNSGITPHWPNSCLLSG